MAVCDKFAKHDCHWHLKREINSYCVPHFAFSVNVPSILAEWMGMASYFLGLHGLFFWGTEWGVDKEN